MTVTAGATARRDFAWLSAHIPENAHAFATDISSGLSTLSLMGPNARALLSEVAEGDLSNAAFPFATSREIEIGSARVRASRITYVGELGWELHIPVEFALTVYDALSSAGAPHGMRDAGYRAIETLRLEKGYRAWGADIGPDHTPHMAGLGWAVKLRTQQSFLGREALERAAAEKHPRLLAGFTVEDPAAVLLGRETIFRDGVQVGWLTSGGFGHTIGKPIGYGYVRSEHGLDATTVQSGHYELEIAGERVPARVTLKPLVDPASAKIRS